MPEHLLRTRSSPALASRSFGSEHVFWFERTATSTAAAAAAAADDGGDSDDRRKLAVAISLLRSKFLKNRTSPPPPPPPPPPAESDVLRWKRKAKERKQELLRLREDLKEAEEASHSAAFPQVASCKCYFFDDLGKLSPDRLGDGSDHRFSDVLRRRFLRQGFLHIKSWSSPWDASLSFDDLKDSICFSRFAVRFRESKRRRDDLHQRRHLSDVTTIDEVEHLCAAADFLVELCDATSSVEEDNFANWSHQAVDFILASLKNLLSVKENMESIEGIVNSLILRLVRRMTSLLGKDGGRDDVGNDVQFHVQHLIRKLGTAVYLGQRALVAVSQKIPVVAESILFSDPFDDKFPDMHQYMFILIQLLEFLVCDYLLTWSRDENFDQLLFEEWLTSIIYARKALGVLESSNSLYMLYMDRVVGELARQLGQISSNHKLNPDVLTNLFL
ncbi:protein MULTIPOLAR SPINDLE 1 [Eucalyptus grandis]|uniref:protein MULTIPOLAR SPINDLE 1 n=1 Tax=Eucalyptus grandis TaxID=71139 RepID=UPI00192F0BC9|nr:protein MULTIPOLAR SPINDLE 1 [Eucalyptus grandis]